MSKDPLIEQINNHEVLHDMITHLEDFKTAVYSKIDFGELDEDDMSYWQKQIKTLNRLTEYVKNNS